MDEKEKLFEQFVQAGGTFSDCVHYFGKKQTAEQLEYAEIAKELEEEGEMEFDDVPIVSDAETENGAYVMAWIWISGPDEKEEEDE